jgi:hypothetical protein
VRFIILVTGESEYDRCSDDLIAIARELGYSIYAIEMQASDVEDPGVMLQHLRDITGDTNQKPGAPNKAITCQAPTEQLPEALSMKLQEALNAAITEPVATNVTIYESFYDYIVPSDEAYVEILQIPNSYTKINTKTSNNIVSINLPYDLPENNTTEVTLEYGLALKDLPVSVGNNPTSIMLASRGNTTSHMRYTWLKTHSIDKYLPEISINIESANPKGTTSATTKTTDSKFGIMTLLSFLVFVIFCRIKERR